jgi:electron transfer flavoprotein alpha subunit
MTGALVVAEARLGALRPITGELVAAAHGLVGDDVRLLLVGQAAEALAAELDVGPLAEVIVASSPVAGFDPDVTRAAVESAQASRSAEVIVLGHTSDGLSVGPALAAMSGYGFASDVTQAGHDGEALVAIRGVYGGRLEAEVRFPGHRTTVLLMRPGGHASNAGASAAPVSRFEVAVAPRVEHMGLEVRSGHEADLAAAELVIGIGRGVEDAADVPRLAELARLLGGTLVGTSPLIDSGWLPASRRVGQHGRSVQPKVYLALGISGAPEHMAGVKAAETVIAVNTDPRAPIFRAADFGVVADLSDVADALARLVAGGSPNPAAP